MIPVPIFSGVFLIILGISFLAAVSVLVWAAALILIPRVRRSFRARQGRSIGILGALCVMSLVFVHVTLVSLEVDRKISREQAALHPTLAHAEHLLGIDMPSGTKLTLTRAGDMTSISDAEFPHAVSVYGIPATALGVRAEYDDEAPRDDGQLPPSLTALSLTGTGNATVDGWVCGTGGPLEIVLRRDARIKTLWACHLAEGNRVAHSVIPVNSTLMRSTTTYGDGLRDNDYWRIDVPDGSVFELAGLPLRHPSMQLDKQHNVVAFSYAELARAFTLGDITYPAGTEVSSAQRGLREKYPGTWVFSLEPGQPAIGKEKGAMPDVRFVAQAPSGKVYALYSK
ncbi:hypothetical protein [Burkholderia ubonensis]|uniref:Uncharacterized protein n=1 Tax=Burkholderia ubonensis subsp. mesacidophila TaxID=265293 RepID=A0A2A4F7F2_9BURK|nr:hypothetical protein [Burkholderia ubonensis]PCE29763.1 hypothetical protein BZL54_24520 [Burkholderia ubonensis subsp. mesacidophila]